MGSFFIPMAVMLYVYVRISCVVAARHDHMTEIEVHKVIAQVNIYIPVVTSYLYRTYNHKGDRSLALTAPKFIVIPTNVP